MYIRTYVYILFFDDKNFSWVAKSAKFIAQNYFIMII